MIYIYCIYSYNAFDACRVSGQRKKYLYLQYLQGSISSFSA